MRLLRGKNGKIHPLKLAVLIAAVLVVFVPFCTGPRGLFTLIRLHRDVSVMQTDIEQTAQENTAIRDSINALEKEDPMALEKEARDLGMIKDGETVYKVVPKEE